MQASYSKLQEYFSEKLPDPEKLAELLTFHSYEVTGIKKVNGDYIFDIDVLPNRAGDSSEDAGVVKEISAILNTPFKKKPFEKKESTLKISVSGLEINKLLGSDIPAEEIENIFKRLGFEYKIKEDEFTVSVPFERTDLKIKADLIEEVTRIYGYENIEAKLPEKAEKAPKVDKKFYYTNKIKNILSNEGFSEVYMYSFRDSGEVEIEKPFASDKNFLRKDLRVGLESALKQNIRNIPLLEGNEIKIFEIGNIFNENKEYTSLGIVHSGGLGKVEDIVNKLSETLGVKIEGDIKENVFEGNFNNLLDKLPEPPEFYEKFEKPKKDITFSPIFPYPFVLRDIAVFVPKDVLANDVLNIIKKEGGVLLVNTKLFDVFEKDDKVSYAFNLVFQSQEKTLSDDEVNKIMDHVTTFLNSKDGWKVR